MGLFLALLALLALYLDPSDSKVAAGALISIVPNLLTFYLGNAAAEREPVAARSLLAVKPVNYRVPDSMAFSLVIASLVLFLNLLLAAFNANIVYIGEDEHFYELQAAATGALTLGSFLPLSAILAARIGFRPAPFALRSILFAVAITMGSLTAIAALNTLIHGNSALEGLLTALFRPTGTAPLPIRGQVLLMLLTVGSGLLSVVIFGLWLAAWARFGR